MSIKVKELREIVGFDQESEPVLGDPIYPITSVDAVVNPDGGDMKDWLEGVADVAADAAVERKEVGRDTIYQQRETARDTAYATKENARDTLYQQAEQSRQTTFQGNETTRQTNESTRQSQEQSRQQAESGRQATFAQSEQSRSTTFAQSEQSRTNTFAQSEASRDTTFESKEATRDAANEAALNCAEELTELSQKVGALALGKFYGYFPSASNLPEGDEDGYAYVGASSPFAIYNFNGTSWTDSGSTIANISIADDEDLTSVNGKLKFKDRSYGGGMAYIILRREDDFKSRVNNVNNTIFEVRYDFNLNSQIVKVGTNCEFVFNGGSVNNGTLNLYNHPYCDKFCGTAYLLGAFGIKNLDDKYYPIYPNNCCSIPVLEDDVECISIYGVVDGGITYESNSVDCETNATYKVQLILNKSDKKICLKYNNKYYLNWRGSIYEKAHYCNADNTIYSGKLYYTYAANDNYYMYDNDGNEVSFDNVAKRDVARFTSTTIPSGKIAKLIGNVCAPNAISLSGGNKIVDVTDLTFDKKSPLSGYISWSSSEPDAKRSNGYELIGYDHLLLDFETLVSVLNYDYYKNRTIDVTKYGIGNNGEDCTIKLQRLINAYGHSSFRTYFYFPRGVYALSDTIYYGNNCPQGFVGDSICNEETKINFTANSSHSNKFLFNLCNESKSFNSLGFSGLSVFANTMTMTRATAAEDIPGLATGILPYHTPHITITNVSFAKAFKGMFIKNCYIRGFSGIGFYCAGSFVRIIDCNIRWCGIGVFSPVSDLNVRGTYVTGCRYGIISTGCLDLTDDWLDEMSQYAIYSGCVDNGEEKGYTDILGNMDLSEFSTHINAVGIHFNHIDKSAIRTRTLYGIIDGIINRTNCNYAGRTLNDIPELRDKKDASILQAIDISRLSANISVSNKEIGDADASGVSNRGRCGVYPVYAQTLKGSDIKIDGKTNDHRGFWTDQNGFSSKSLIRYVDDDDDLKYWDYTNNVGKSAYDLIFPATD